MPSEVITIKIIKLHYKIKNFEMYKFTHRNINMCKIRDTNTKAFKIFGLFCRFSNTILMFKNFPDLKD